MALITAPSAEEIYNASKLTPEHFEDDNDASKTDADIIAMIDAEILPDVVGDVNMAVDEASLPFDFPFDEAMLGTVYPTRSSEANTQWIATEQGRFRRVILWLSLAELYSRVASLDVRYDEKAKMYKAWADAKMKEAIMAIKSVVTSAKGLEPVDAEDEIGIAVVNYFPARISGL